MLDPEQRPLCVMRRPLKVLVIPEQSSVCSQSSDRNTDVIINMEDLLLMSSELRLCPLKQTHTESEVIFSILYIHIKTLTYQAREGVFTYLQHGLLERAL